MGFSRTSLEADMASRDERVRVTAEIVLRARLRTAMRHSLANASDFDAQASAIEAIDLELTKLGDQLIRLHWRRLALAKRVQKLREERDELASGADRPHLPRGWEWSRRHLSE